MMGEKSHGDTMTSEGSRIVEETRASLEAGAALDQVASSLRARGLTILEAIKVLRSAAGIGLEEAKAAIAENPSWRDVVSASESLQADAESVARKLVGG